VKRFCTLDAQGTQLSKEGWQEMSEWFSQPRGPFPGKFIVFKDDFDVSKPELKSDEAAFSVEYIELARMFHTEVK
jgi:hypothetical protein